MHTHNKAATESSLNISEKTFKKNSYTKTIASFQVSSKKKKQHPNERLDKKLMV